MSFSASKEYVSNVLYGNLPTVWYAKAIGFYYSVDPMYQASKRPETQKLVQAHEVYIWNFRYKVSCYLLSHCIELLLKSLCAEMMTYEEIMKESHGLNGLIDKLVSNGMLNSDDINGNTVKKAQVYIHWYGRYHRPKNEKNLTEFIEENFADSTDREGFIQTKIDLKCQKTFNELLELANHLMRTCQEKFKGIDWISFDAV